MRSNYALIVSLLLLAAAVPTLVADEAPFVRVKLPAATQGPLWPPGIVTDANGDFPVVGIHLIEVNGTPGIPLLGQPFMISKDTVPPLDASGNRILNNWFAGSYDFVRPLDLNPGSPDLDMVLYNLSFGPVDESGVARIPASGDSAFNLTTDPHPCQELFPTDLQAATYERPRFPLHEVPIWGFQGDGIRYGRDSGAVEVPNQRVDFREGCVGCAGENNLDQRPRRDPITLGQWLNASGKVTIRLDDFNAEAGAYTAATFRFNLRNMLPNSIYTVQAVRNRRIPGFDFFPQGDPLAIPNVIVTNEWGRGRGTFKAHNPFPDPATDFTGERITGLVVTWHPDYQNWGACGARFGAGVDLMTQLNSFVEGNFDLTPFITVPAP
ncbi:MAG: hypothetical protein AAF604_14720 [Acidobacteriota bacterium]